MYKKHRVDTFILLFSIMCVLVIFSSFGLLLYDLQNTKNINDDLKSELYQVKNDLKETRDEKLRLSLKCKED